MKSLYGNLRESAPLEDGALRAIPPGGLGEIGRNINVLKHGSKLFIVDCGVLFPEAYQPGVNPVLPDFSWVVDRLNDVVGIVITHGHEDHTDAVPYLVRLRNDIPVYGSDLVLAFIEPKLREHRLPADDICIVKNGDRLQLGPFELGFVQVIHSVPDALAICMRTSASTALITGGFKIDHQPLGGCKTDLAALGRIGSKDVDSFMVDSTDSEVPGFIPSESEIDPALDRIVEEVEGQIVVTAFTSYVYRVQQVMNAATKAGHHVTLVGRSVERNMRIATEKDYLTVPADLIVNASELVALSFERRLYMTTGSQGEPRVALMRVSAGSRKFVNLEMGDTVAVTASLIPNNETDVNRTINEPIQLGMRVFHHGNAEVHVSDHAYRDELLTFYNLAQPKNVMPTHGESCHLVKNGQLTVSAGVPASWAVLTDDGVAANLKGGRTRISGQAPCELIFADGRSISEISEEEPEIRRILGSEGFISVYTVVKHDSGTVLSGPMIKAVGMAGDDAVFDEALLDAESAFKDAAAPGGKDPYVLRRAMRCVLER